MFIACRGTRQKVTWKESPKFLKKKCKRIKEDKKKRIQREIKRKSEYIIVILKNSFDKCSSTEEIREVIITNKSKPSIIQKKKILSSEFTTSLDQTNVNERNALIKLAAAAFIYSDFILASAPQSTGIKISEAKVIFLQLCKLK